MGKEKKKRKKWFLIFTAAISRLHFVLSVSDYILGLFFPYSIICNHQTHKSRSFLSIFCKKFIKGLKTLTNDFFRIRQVSFTSPANSVIFINCLSIVSISKSFHHCAHNNLTALTRYKSNHP